MCVCVCVCEPDISDSGHGDNLTGAKPSLKISWWILEKQTERKEKERYKTNPGDWYEGTDMGASVN